MTINNYKKIFSKFTVFTLVLVISFSIFPTKTLGLDPVQKKYYDQNILDYDKDIGCQNVAPAQAQAGIEKAYIVGDSITLGSAAAIVQSFSQKSISVNINASVSRSILRDGQTEGKRTSGLEAVEADMPIIVDSQAVIIALGTNSDGSAETYSTNMEKMVAKI